MADKQVKSNLPVRVVVFTSGPQLERGVQRFLARLEDHPQIELIACLAQARHNNRRAAYAELWKRRGALAVAILLAQWFKTLWRTLHDPRREFALRRQIKALKDRILFVPDLHHPVVLKRVSSLSPDLGLVYGSPVLKPALFEIPALGTLGIHHGKMPQYRGKKTLFWAMYNGEQTAGVTIQKINADLDAGLIVKQGEVPVGRRFPGAVWEDLDELGLNLYIQAILEVQQGTAGFRKPDGIKGKLYRDPSVRDILILWQRILTRSVRQ